ncbi:MAG: hypothetical protein VX278_21185 [Myxococcota bacterium]|nr:hypothetical protein [Myxococcota bacterium]
MLSLLASIVLATPSDSWMGTLRLDIEKDGGRFTLLGKTTDKTAIVLPGNKGLWPFSISDQQKFLATIAYEELPYTELESGDHKITGDFSWVEVPAQIQIPPNISHLELYIQNKKVEYPIIQNGHTLLLKDADQPDHISLSVNRKILDLYPTHIQTDIQLQVTGESRRISIPFPVLGNDTILNIESSASAWYDNEQIWLHAQPGTHSIRVNSRTAQTVLFVPKTPEPWPAEETWILPSTSSRQIKQEQTIDLAPKTVSKQILSLQKDVWLTDQHLYVEDRLQGFSTETVSLLPTPQSAAVQQITPPQSQNPDGEIFLRSPDVKVQIDRQTNRSSLHTVGWQDLNIHSLSVFLHYPSSWKLLYISGLQSAPFYRVWLPQLFLWMGILGMFLWRAPKNWSLLGGICLGFIAIGHPLFLIFITVLLLFKPFLQKQRSLTRVALSLLYAAFITYIVQQELFTPVQMLEKEIALSSQQNTVLNLHWLDPFYNILRLLIFIPLFSLCLWKAMRKNVNVLLAFLTLFCAFSLDSTTAQAADFCTPKCTDAPLLSLKIEQNTLEMEGEIHALRQGEWPLPGPIQNFRPTSLTINGQPYHATRKEKNGHIHLYLEPGVWHFRAVGTIQEPLYLFFPQKVQQLNFYSLDHQVEGLHPNGSHESYLMISKQNLSQERLDYGTLEVEIRISSVTEIRYTFERNPHFSLPLLLTIPAIDRTEEIYPPQEISLSAEESKKTWTITFPTTESFRVEPTQHPSIVEFWNVECVGDRLCERDNTSFLQRYHAPTQGSVFTVQTLHPFPNPLLSKDGVYRIWEDETKIYQELQFSFQAPLSGSLPFHFTQTPATLSIFHNNQKKTFNSEIPYREGKNEYRIRWSTEPYTTLEKPPIPNTDILFERLSLTMSSYQRVLVPLTPAVLYKYVFGFLFVSIASLLLARHPFSKLRFREWLILLLGSVSLHWMLPFALIFSLFLFSSKTVKEVPSGLFIVSLITALYYTHDPVQIEIIPQSEIPSMQYIGIPYWLRDLLFFLWCLWTLFVLRRLILHLSKQTMEIGGSETS